MRLKRGTPYPAFLSGGDIMAYGDLVSRVDYSYGGQCASAMQDVPTKG
jgi:hypothetical protein